FPGGLKDGGYYVIEDIGTAFLAGQFSDAEVYHPAKIGEPGEVNIFPSHQNGMIGLVKQIFDHVMSPVAAGGWYGVERMLVLTSLAIMQKKHYQVGLPADFDPVRYLELNQDVAALGADPVRHYLDFGWRERRRLR